MLEKIDKFIDKYLDWKVLLHFGIAELCFLPYMLITSTYDIPMLFKMIMIASIGLAVSHMRIAIQNIKKHLNFQIK